MTNEIVSTDAELIQEFARICLRQGRLHDANQLQTLVLKLERVDRGELCESCLLPKRQLQCMCNNPS